MNKKELKRVIKEYLKENDVFEWDALEDIKFLAEKINEELDDTLNIEMRGTFEGTDYGLQAEYFSDKLQKIIIFDYDYPSSFENIDEFVNIYLEKYKEIKEFESFISFNKK